MFDMPKYFSFKKYGLVMVALAVLTGCPAAPDQCANRQPGVVVLGEGSDAVRANSTTFRRIAAPLESTLTGAGVKVMDADRITGGFPEYFAEQKSRHNAREIAEIVRSIPANGVDAIVLLSPRVMTSNQDGYQRVSASMDVRMISTKTEQVLTSFSLETDVDRAIRPGCTGSCLDDAAVDSLRPLAVEAAKMVASDVPCSGPRLGGGDFDDSIGGMVTGWEINFEGFTQDEVATLEDYLQSFAGYSSHRVSYAGARSASFWYESRLRSASLNRNLYLAVERMGLRPFVQFSGRVFRVQKITLRGGDRRSRETLPVPVGDDAERRRAELNDW